MFGVLCVCAVQLVPMHENMGMRKRGKKEEKNANTLSHSKGERDKDIIYIKTKKKRLGNECVRLIPKKQHTKQLNNWTKKNKSVNSFPSKFLPILSVMVDQAPDKGRTFRAYQLQTRHSVSNLPLHHHQASSVEGNVQMISTTPSPTMRSAKTKTVVLKQTGTEQTGK